MKIFRDESGQTLAMVALSMTLLLGFTAFATDIGVMLHEKREVQNAADSAAIAAARAVSSRQDGTTAGKNDAALNGFTDQATDSSGNVITTVTINLTPLQGHFTGLPGYVEAIVTHQTPAFFMGFFGRDSMAISGRAVATYLGEGTACGYVNNPTGSNPAGNPWGNSTIDAEHCGILFNGNVMLGASDSVTAAYIGATGTITGATHIDGTYENGIPEFSDPLSYLSAPQGALPSPNADGKTCTPPVDPAAPQAALPNCYLNQPLSGTLQPGVYYYTDPSAATYTGAVDGTAGVTIILTNNSLLSTSGGSGAGNASLNLTAPSSGFYSGIVLDAPTYTGTLNLDFGATAATFTGAVYAPNADLSLQDQGANGSTTTGYGLTINGTFVVGTLDVDDKNKGNLQLNGFPPDIPSPIPRISLVE